MTCDEPGVVVGTQCLRFVQETRTWDGAADGCVTLGGTLASLRHPQALADYVNNNGGKLVMFICLGTDLLISMPLYDC